MIEAASVLVREKGLAGVTVEAVCSRIGLTTGGFYKQFASREALILEALGSVVEERRSLMSGLGDPTGAGARDALVDVYLTDEHRDGVGHGCLVAALAGDPELAASDAANGLLRRGLLDLLSAASAPDDAPSEALAIVALLVGTLQLARMTAGTDLSEEILAAARAVLAERSR